MKDAPSDQMPILDIDGLRIAIATRAGIAIPVDDVSLRLARGESLGIIGESGSGKTSLARAVMGDLPKDARLIAGCVQFDGADVTGSSPADLMRLRSRGMAMVHQHAAAALNPVITIGEQLREVPIFQFAADRNTAHEQSVEVLGQVQIADPARAMASYPHQLSGGQLQRVVIAMALLSRPRLLVLDEPTTGLDATVQAEILDLVARLRRASDMAVLYISHDLGVAARVCDRLGVLYAGQIVESGNTASILQAPQHPYTRGLVRSLPSIERTKHDVVLRPIPGVPPSVTDIMPGCRFAERCEYAEEACRVAPIALSAMNADESALIRCRRWGGLPPEDQRAAPRAAQIPSFDEILLDIKDLNKTYRRPGAWIDRSAREFVANRNINLSIHRNEIFAVVGESGSGKSTLAKIVAGLETPTSGTVSFDGVSIGHLETGRRSPAVRRAIQLISQNTEDTLNPSYTVGWQIGRAVRRLRQGLAGATTRVTENLLDAMRLPRMIAGRWPHSLSGGQRQRVSIARAIAGDPQLIVADEPVSALDVSVQAAILELLLQLNRENGVSILLISHDLAVVHHIADRIAVLYRGTVVEAGSTSQVFAAPYHPYTEALLSAAPTIASDGPRVILHDARGSERQDAGCVFAQRCPRNLGAICFDQAPPERRTTEGLSILCHIELPDLTPAQRQLSSAATSGAASRFTEGNVRAPT